MSPENLLILYSAVIVMASLLGGLVPSLLKLGHRGLQFVLSFVAGVMLGVGFFHMLPHAVMLRAEHAGEVDHHTLDPIMMWTVIGFLSLFLLERFSHFHQHEAPPSDGGEVCPEHGDVHDREHAHPAGQLGWFGALAGLGVHCLFEGVALAASVAVGAAQGGDKGGAIAGLATFLVIVLHKPFDSMTLATLMRRAGAGRQIRVLAQLLLAALVPVGVALFWAGVTPDNMEEIAPIALAFSAGMFVCIASSDLLPELQFHRHDRIALSVALLIGLGLAFVLGRFEASTHVHVESPQHQHDH